MTQRVKRKLLSAKLLSATWKTEVVGTPCASGSEIDDGMRIVKKEDNWLCTCEDCSHSHFGLQLSQLGLLVVFLFDLLRLWGI